ncbi:hypothetical protein CH63R_07895 [Colletotrichum higginsianum IMI 349063]|uniref:Uncharacterized protein n=1 Tax=Colletotrichum higginsianum (strain IMI 349063) TaxID=759273 RepID=A0A1B7YB74_COLHI|nr:hypothetical protein CH63R_07895 [Colletotrichum higginsianum IMI 349063]OBR09130.1 hypothetical protein CH63R_07895 [Colletotrichum higginsianum IMI 349063]
MGGKIGRSRERDRRENGFPGRVMERLAGGRSVVGYAVAQAGRVLKRTAEALEAAHPNDAPLLVFTISKLTMAMMTFQGGGRGTNAMNLPRPDQRRPEARNNVGAVFQSHAAATRGQIGASGKHPT